MIGKKGFQKGINNPRYSHGMRHTKFYNVWGSMKDRCLNKNHKWYLRYGGRGITVCKRWLTFENFRNDMYQSYQKHLKQHGKINTTIDRIDNDGNYCKENCRWAIWKEQAKNRIYKQKIITYNGISLTIGEWAKKYNIEKGTLASRINNYKWPVKKALTTPLDYSKRNNIKKIIRAN